MSTGCSLKRTFSRTYNKKSVQRPLNQEKHIERRDPRGLETQEDVADVQIVLKEVNNSCKRIKKELPKLLRDKDPEIPKQEIEEYIRTLRRNIDDLHKLLNLSEYETERERELKADKNGLLKELKCVKNQKQTLRKELDNIQELAKARDSEENNSLHNELAERQHEVSNLQQKLDKDREENNSLRDELAERQNEVLNLQQKLDKKKTQDIVVPVSPFQDQSKLHAEINRLEEKLQKEVHAKENALTRLSALAAIKLKDNNPNITDLSDPNRPMKLAEKMSEVYDDDWTDAIENLEGFGLHELDGIRILLNILTETFTVCKDWSTNQLSTIKSLLVYPPFDDEEKESKHKKKKRAPPPPNPFTGELDCETSHDSAEEEMELICELPSPQEIIKQIKDYRKMVAANILPKIQKVIIHHLQSSLHLNDENSQACGPYIQKCVELCWYMVVQDPPLFLQWQLEHGHPFPSGTFRSYTKRGNKVDYVVWPTLYLYEGGSILAKGVCQGLK